MFYQAVRLTWHHLQLNLAHPWRISRSLASSKPQNDHAHVVVVRLVAPDGVWGLGEAAPSSRYYESPATVEAFLARVDAPRWTLLDPGAGRSYLDSLAPGNHAAKCALNLAWLDLAARRAGQPLHQFLQLGFREAFHRTSYSLGIDAPDRIRLKAEAAAHLPILKLKLGGPHDDASLAAVRSVAPTKPVRVDANEAWADREQALRRIEHLARDPHIEFVEQPMPATAPARDQAWLRARSPLPLFADESCHTAADIPLCAEGFHGVNVKLVKTAGISGALDTLHAARRAGLKTMLGCMVETSILISAAAHRAELADHLDLDGNLLITNDPYRGVRTLDGQLTFAHAPERFGLRVGPAPEPAQPPPA